MEEESWDAENFEPKLATTLSKSNKWEGEDEEEDVKESWEDEEEEKKDDEKPPPQQPAKPKKKLHEKIAEKERMSREHTVEKEKVMTPEEKLAEKLRRQKLQEESDLRLAMETFGLTDGGSGSGKIDSFHPTNKEEFVEFADVLSKKITFYKNKDEFPVFVEDLVRNITVSLSSLDIKRVKMTIDNIYIEKQKAEKNEKSKKTKGKGKTKLKVEGDNAHMNEYEGYANYNDEYDDFM